MATNPSHPVARVYAVALYETARDKGIVGEVHTGMELIGECWSDKSFRDFFTSPRVPSETKIKGLHDALYGKVAEEVLNFLYVLIAKGREPVFDNILTAFEAYRDEAENRAHAWVESGSEFTEAEKEDIKRRLSEATGGKAIVLHYEHKPDLLGGARIRLGDSLIDNSLRSRLRKLAQALEV